MLSKVAVFDLFNILSCWIFAILALLDDIGHVIIQAVVVFIVT
jgi:hypothetical protein